MGSVVVVDGFSCSKECGISSQARDQTCVPYIGRKVLKHWTTKEVLGIVILIYDCALPFHKGENDEPQEVSEFEVVSLPFKVASARVNRATITGNNQELNLR